MVKIQRSPTTPGEILEKEFMKPLKITQKSLADHIGVDIKVINRLINGRTSVSADLALRLSSALKTTPQFWLNAQLAVDIYKAKKKQVMLPGPIF